MKLPVRKSTSMLLFFLSGLFLVLLSLADAASRRASAAEVLKCNATLVGELGLSDLALFTEARYARHLSLADRHAAFQDHPVSLDHFPSGSIVLPPAQLRP